MAAYTGGVGTPRLVGGRGPLIGRRAGGARRAPGELHGGDLGGRRHVEAGGAQDGRELGEERRVGGREDDRRALGERAVGARAGEGRHGPRGHVA